MQNLYILSQSECQGQLVVREIGVLKVGDKDLKGYLKTKSACVVTETIEDYINKFSSVASTYSDQKLREIIKAED